jgi:hypothetical protein
MNERTPYWTVPVLIALLAIPAGWAMGLLAAALLGSAALATARACWAASPPPDRWSWPSVSCPRMV